MVERRTEAQADELRGRWKWYLALGVLLLALGTAGVGAATMAEWTSFLVFAPLLLASSIMQILTALSAEKGKVFLLHLIAAGLEAALGFLIMAYPVQMGTDLVVLVAVFLLVSGVVRLIRSGVRQSSGRGGILLTGLATLLLGICVWLRLPVSKLWFVGLCIALDFICQGFSWSAIALAERRSLQGPDSENVQAVKQPVG
jgi:uncharacterized membrane protein HdeD (DUF308 family)